MAYYFDPTDAEDLKLLKSDVRTNSELTNVANSTEDKVRGMYSEWNCSTEVYDVKLRGFLDTGDPDDTYPDFKKAFKQTVANCISWTLRNYSVQAGLKRDKRGNREKEWQESFEAETFPNNLFSRLTLFDTKTSLYY